MQYAIELYFDTQSENTLSELAQRIADEKLSTKFLEWKTRPHITLACFNDVDEEKCIGMLNTFVSDHPKIPAYLGSVGMFNDTRTIFAMPIMTKELFDFQSELHECMSGFDTTGWEWYCPDLWVPHCTLALTKDDDDCIFYKAAELVLHEFKKISGTYISIGLVKITFPVNEIYTAELK